MTTENHATQTVALQDELKAAALGAHDDFVFGWRLCDDGKPRPNWTPDNSHQLERLCSQQEGWDVRDFANREDD